MKFKVPSYQKIAFFFKANFDLAYEHHIDFEKLFVSFRENYENIFLDIYAQSPIFFEFKGQKFPVFIHQHEKQLYNEQGILSFDVYLNTFLFLSGWLEVISTQKDKHGRFPYEASLQKKYSFVEVPLVNIYFELIKDLAIQQGFDVIHKKQKTSLAFTHDIDQLRSGWYENIMFYKENLSLKSFFEISKNIAVKVFGLKDDYWKGMEKMLALDKAHQVKGISFFLSEKSHQDADFNLENPVFKSILAQAKASQEIGLHAGYNTFNNLEELLSQKQKLELIFEQKITKSRQHFLRYDTKETPYIIDKVGIEEDYTLGFAEQYGFRNGIANPFFLYHFKENKPFSFLSVPLVFMDASLTNYQAKEQLNQAKTAEVIRFIRKINSEFNCHYSVLFHNSAFSNAKYKGFEELYKVLLKLNS